MLKKVLLITALAVSSLVSAQDYVLGGNYSFSGKFLDASYGGEIGYNKVGVIFMSGAFLDESSLYTSVDDILDGKLVTTGGTYSRVGIFLRQIRFKESDPISLRIGAGIQTYDKLGVQGTRIKRNEGYTTNLLAGIEMNVPNSAVYMSFTIFTDIVEDFGSSAVFGFGFKL